MTSKTTERFRKAYAGLPEHIRRRARVAYRTFLEDPNHPSLRFKQVHATRPIYSARVGLGYRALAVPDGVIVALISAIVWLVADITSGRTFTHPLIPFWNASVRFGLFTIVVIMLSKLKLTHDARRSLSASFVRPWRT